MKDEAYLKPLKLERNPFPVAPDDEMFYVSGHIEQIIAELVHGVEARKGFMVLSGEVGVGKTTVSRKILNILADRNVSTSLVFHTSLKDVGLLREINRDFGLLKDEADQQCGLGELLQKLNQFLLEQYHAGSNCAIIIDDAQNLDHESLELIRMISNLEADQQKLVQILLVGQTELMGKLNAHAMRQLHSRIVIRKIMRSLSMQEMRNYIMFKLSSSGDTGGITVTLPAFRALYHHTGGNLRQLNLVMDRCLYAICHCSRRRINWKVVRLAYFDLFPEKSRFKKRVFALACSLMLPIIVAIASWGLHLHTSRAVNASVSLIQKHRKVPGLRSAQSIKAQTSGAIGRAAMADTKAMNTDSAVQAFMSVYQLDRYATDFQQALQSDTLDRIAHRIYLESGLQLVQLARVPDRVRRHYGALTFSVGPQKKPVWLLFWQPQVEIKRFYQNYKGREIKTLQSHFADLDLYHYHIDGIVGHRLIAAVTRFQRQHGLDETGFPDAETLFWLCHQQKEGALWPKA